MVRNVKREKIKELLLKAAKGYQVAEVTVEYAEVNGKMQVTKRKETKKASKPKERYDVVKNYGNSRLSCYDFL